MLSTISNVFSNVVHCTRSRKIPLQQPPVFCSREKDPMSMSPTPCLTSFLVDFVARPFYIKPNWTFSRDGWRQPTDFWSNWSFWSRIKWVSTLGNCGMTIVDKSYIEKDGGSDSKSSGFCGTLVFGLSNNYLKCHFFSFLVISSFLVFWLFSFLKTKWVKISFSQLWPGRGSHLSRCPDQSSTNSRRSIEQIIFEASSK